MRLGLEPAKRRGGDLRSGAREGVGPFQYVLEPEVRVRVEEAGKAGRVAADQSRQVGGRAKDGGEGLPLRRGEGVLGGQDVEEAFGRPGVHDRAAGTEPVAQPGHATSGRIRAARRPGPEPS